MPATRLVAVLAVVAAALSSAALARPMDCDRDETFRPSVTVRANGDDGLTQRLRDAIESAYRACDAGFIISQGGSGRLTVTITESVGWKKIGERTRVTYKVDYAVYGETTARRVRSP